MFDISYVLVGMPFLFAILFALALCLMTFACYRSATAGLWFVSVLFAIEMLLPGLGPLSLGMQVYLPDVVTVFLGAVALARFIFARPRPKILLIWHIFLIVIGISFALGVSRYGTLAGTSLRTYFYAVAVASYFMTFPMETPNAQRVLSAFAWFSALMAVVVLARWVVVVVPISALLPPGGRFASSEASELRVIASEEAIVIAQALVVMLFFSQVTPSMRRLRILLPLLVIVVVVLQHRSVWAACFVGLLGRFMLPAQGRRAGGQLIALIIATVVIALPLALSGRFGGAGADIAQSANRAVTLSDTAQGRLDTWRFILGRWREGGARAIAVGQPFGTSMDRVEVSSVTGDQRHIGFSAHNFYMQTLFSTGLIGLGMSIALFCWVQYHLYRLVRDPERAPVASALFLLVLVQMAFYIPYGIHYWQGVVLGVAVAYVRTVRGQMLPARPAWNAGATLLSSGRQLPPAARLHRRVP